MTTDPVRTLVFIVFLLVLIYTLYLLRRYRGLIRNLKKLSRETAENKVSLVFNRDDDLYEINYAIHNLVYRLREQRRSRKENENHLQTMLALMPAPVILLDRECRLQYMNPAAEESLFSFSRKDPKDFFSAWLRRPDLRGFVKKVLFSLKRQCFEFSLQEEDHALFWNMTGCRLNNQRGEISGILLLIHDISERVRLEKLNQQFIANVSHELKTPVTSLVGYSELLEEEELSKESRNLLKVIKRQSVRMQHIIEDLLLLTRLENLPKKPEKEMIPVQGLFGSMSQMFRGKQVLLKTTIGRGVKEIKAHPLLFELALKNLVENAVKHSPAGRTVTLRAFAEEDEYGFSVRDQGPGIPDEEQGKIFTRFYRIDKGRNRKLGGTGLGLSLVKHILEVHGGRITLKSSPGHGSTFTMYLKRHT